jgi:hypothetical protein
MSNSLHRQDRPAKPSPSTALGMQGSDAAPRDAPVRTPAESRTEPSRLSSAPRWTRCCSPWHPGRLGGAGSSVCISSKRPTNAGRRHRAAIYQYSASVIPAQVEFSLAVVSATPLACHAPPSGSQPGSNAYLCTPGFCLGFSASWLNRGCSWWPMSSCSAGGWQSFWRRRVVAALGNGCLVAGVLASLDMAAKSKKWGGAPHTMWVFQAHCGLQVSIMGFFAECCHI